MTTCAKCGAELIGSAKFCASCGAATSKIDEFATTSPAGAKISPVRLSEPPAPSEVNPFASTASPATGGVKEQTSAVPVSRRPEPSQISPLAVSNAITPGGSFKEAVDTALEKARATAAAPAPVKKPGTKMMPNRPNARESTPPAATPEAPKKAVARTVAMGFNPRATGPQSGAGAGAAPDSRFAFGPQSAAPSGATPIPPPHPGPAPTFNPQSRAMPYPQPQPVPQQMGAVYTPPNAYPQRGAPGVPPAYPPYPFAYVPGTRVHVTWSNGQRYPATVSQVSGSKCLVVFPDGQQHWVEAQYLTPGT